MHLTRMYKDCVIINEDITRADPNQWPSKNGQGLKMAYLYNKNNKKEFLIVTLI